MWNQIRGITIPFETLPVQISVPLPYRMNEVETAGLGGLLGQLLSKGVVGRSPHEEGEWISNVFLRPKPGGEHRMILDLTELNKFIVYEHFKMFSLQMAVELVEEGCWMASVDLKDAYYSVSVSRSNRKYLKFRWKGILYEFRAIPNGLACAPRFFTKILTPIYAGLRQAGHELFPFIDDSFVIVSTQEKCLHSVQTLIKTLDSLGFVIHPRKSVQKPSQELIFLGLVIDSVAMTVSPTEDKKHKFCQVAQSMLNVQHPSIRQVAGLVGMMVAYAQGVDYAVRI